MGAARCRGKFLRVFPGGFADETYIDWERAYKWEAHKKWDEALDQRTFRARLLQRDFDGIAADAVRIESRTNLLFSFEKMAVRDAVKSRRGAQTFARGLYDFLYGAGTDEARFEQWIAAFGSLPRKQTRVLTWPAVTVFGFIAKPKKHIFLKPVVTRLAARAYGYDFHYASLPNWETYSSVLSFARTIRRDVADLRPRDMIDIQSFIWVQGSDEYSE